MGSYIYLELKVFDFSENENDSYFGTVGCIYGAKATQLEKLERLTI
jgi:hypothetical protein